jgi:hypothetical protein
MSAPKILFVDTSIFDGQKYNFGSSIMSAFLEAIKGKKPVLLLPDPIEREVKRHIKERSDEVLRALKAARKEAPFLIKWDAWPEKKNKYELAYELKGIAEKEWTDFLLNFDVQRLGYEDVDLKQMMDWYDNVRAPFGLGEKRKEFPDAFAVAALLAYAKKTKFTVAVVSCDTDFTSACGLYTELLHYPSLQALSEAFLEGDERVEKIKELLEDDVAGISGKINEEFPELTFYPEEDYGGDVSDVEIDEIEFKAFNVMGLGNAECTVAFCAKVKYSAYVEYDDPDTAIVDSSEDVFIPLHEYRGTVSDSAEITGVVKLTVNSSWEAIEGMSLFAIDDSDIVVSKIPPHRSKYEGDDDEPESDETA